MIKQSCHVRIITQTKYFVKKRCRPTLKMHTHCSIHAYCRNSGDEMSTQCKHSTVYCMFTIWRVTLEIDPHCESSNAVYNEWEEYGHVANSLIHYEYMVSYTLLMCWVIRWITHGERWALFGGVFVSSC